MFKNTQPFKPKIQGKKYRLNTGIEVPKNAVNLAHYYIPPLNSDENVIIGDNSSFIIENIHQPKEQLMYVDEDFKLKDYENILNANVESELVQITDKFYQDVPLYYRHKLKYLFYGNSSEESGIYYGDSIVVTDLYNNPLPSSYKYKIILEKAVTDGNLYTVYVYTSFQIENNFQVKCTYNAVNQSEGGFVSIKPSFSENINPQVFFSKANSIMEAITSDNKYYVQKSSQQIKSSIIYTKGVFEDPRKPQLMRVRVTVTFDDNSIETVHFPNEIDPPIELFNKASTLDIDHDKFTGSRQIISEHPIKNYVSPKTIVSVKAVITEIDRDRDSVTLYARPDGEGKLLAETTIDTGSVSKIPDKHYREKNGNILTGYSVLFKDRNPIKLLTPRDTGVLDSWHIRVQNGRFTVKKGLNKYHYFLPEYYAQHFDSEFNYPYLRVVKEKPNIISNKSIKVKNTPLYVSTNDNLRPTNISVYRFDGLGRKWTINIENWNDKDGIINLTDFISENDDIYIDYIFEEQSYIYTGYNFKSSKNIESHVLLDCNPNKHHYISVVEDDEVSDVPSFSLIDKVIYVYIKPAIIEEGGARVYNDQVIKHTLSKMSVSEMDTEHWLLLGSIYIRPNSSFYSLNLTDTRSRGGGLLEDISDSLRRELEPESDYYWDIGYWDGEPYPENSVIMLRVDKRILKQFGGRFTEEQVQKAAEKHVAFGMLVLIEYATTYTEDELRIDNLEILIEPTNKLHYKPEMFMSVDLGLPNMLLNVEVFDDMKAPEFTLEVIQPVPTPEFNVVNVLPAPSMLMFEVMDGEWHYTPSIMDLKALTPFEDGFVPAFAGYSVHNIGKWYKPDLTFTTFSYQVGRKVKTPLAQMTVIDD